ncbi:MAG: Polysaccharide export ATP-binding protein [Candidatus Saccharibacteria bacterium]|nr:Polysaccharide export ATP-binding protein [Candidatus Saccharibacteria bacterium]
MSENSEVAISVKDLYKTFRLPHEQSSGLKQTIINAVNRKKGYEIQKALENISFEIKQGDFFAIVGRNGSGKSTLLKLLAGIYIPDKGSVTINGSLTPFIELGVGFNQELTGRENVFLNGALLGFSKRDMQGMYDDIVEFAELERFMDQKLKNYSSGMQVRLAFSIAIRAKTDILLLDEVLAVGDAAFQQKCYDYFEELKKQKKTVVFISHDMGAIRRFCNRAVYVDNGILTHEGTPSEIADIYLEENMERVREAADKQKDGPNLLSDKHKITGKVLKQAEKDLVFEVSYSAQDDDEMYVGISIMKEGVSVAEINTLPDKILTGKGKLTYTLDTGMFNNGIYQLDAALFKLQNKQLLEFTKRKSEFVIKGEDITRGAALKIKNTWKID